MSEQTEQRQQQGLFASSVPDQGYKPNAVATGLTAEDIRITGNNQVPAPSIGGRKSSRNTYKYILNELTQKIPQLLEGNLEGVNRSLPAPPARAIMNRAVGSCLTYFLDFSGISKVVKESRENLLEAICSLADENQRLACAAAMAEFESRLIQDHAEHAEIEINTSYENLRYLLSADPQEQSLPWQSRLLAAQHFLAHAAKPETVCQGTKIGSEVICLTQKLFTTRPSRLSEMIASAGILGEWQTFDGKTMLVDEHSLKPGVEEILHRSGDNRRSYAVKIIQQLLLNNVLRRRRQSLSYSECTGRPGKEYNGQVLQNKDGALVNPTLAKLTFLELAMLAKFEFEEKSCIIVNTASFGPQTPEHADHICKQDVLVHVSSLSEFTEALNEAKENARLPVTVAVSERRLLAESYRDAVNHCINVVNFNEYGMLKIFNPQLLPGMQRASRISLQRLYNATVNGAQDC